MEESNEPLRKLTSDDPYEDIQNLNFLGLFGRVPVWIPEFDREFSTTFYKSFFTFSMDLIYPEPAATTYCVRCAPIMNVGGEMELEDLDKPGSDCQVCDFLKRKSEPWCPIRSEGDQIVRHNSTLLLGPVFLKEEHLTPFVRLGSNLWPSNPGARDLKFGFPTLPEVGGPVQFALIRTWLQQCDQSHDCKPASESAPPTRLIDVGTLRSNFLRLFQPDQNKPLKYVTLSHCWGQLTKEEEHQFCTTDDNYEARQDGFDIYELPKTFRDAVRVAQNLNIRYLWIDSLCILQGNQDDWKYEAGRMQNVYAGAYCTIAATSASDTKAGFLKRTVSHEHIYVRDALGRPFYISTQIDDFENDVTNARLNKRAWVLQERILSRRTIHFSANQVYFECGNGVYCETYTHLQSNRRKNSLMLDPDFPARLFRSNDMHTMDFIEFLFQEYSSRGLTKNTDRCAAISGLENRIAQALNCRSTFGIFESLLHRCLIWRRSNSKLSQIDYKTQNVPSWSWMAYDGRIKFMGLLHPEVHWAKDVKLEWDEKPVLAAIVRSFRNCTFKHKDTGINDNPLDLVSDSEVRGQIWYDDQGNGNLDDDKGVILGQNLPSNLNWKDMFYVLIVRPTDAESEYKRAGVGWVTLGYDHIEEQGVKARIV